MYTQLKENLFVDEKSTEREDSEIFLKFSSSYEIKDLLGTGVSGVVRRCIEKSTGKQYAVKIVDLTTSDLSDSNILRNSTLQEIAILKECYSHPNIIELHDTFISQTHILLIFELCRRELFDVLTEMAVLSEARTRLIMNQLLSAVEYLHSKNITHRDIKPENILININYDIKLSDFGFAALIKKGTQLTDLCGTFEYLSPELLKNQIYDDKPGYDLPNDMWACGILMFTLLQGMSPFAAECKADTIKNILSCNYNFHNPRWKSISKKAKDLISKLLIDDPKKRISAKEALAHQFFSSSDCKYNFQKSRDPVIYHKPSNLKPLHRFKIYVHVVMAMSRFNKIVAWLPVPLKKTSTDPYNIRQFHRAIDHGAFKLYGHWVTREPIQNRELLFQHNPKKDILTTLNRVSRKISSELGNISPPIDPACFFNPSQTNLKLKPENGININNF